MLKGLLSRPALTWLRCPVAVPPPDGYDDHMEGPAMRVRNQDETLQVVWFSTRPGVVARAFVMSGVSPSDSGHRDPHAGLPAVVARPYNSDGSVGKGYKANYLWGLSLG